MWGSHGFVVVMPSMRVVLILSLTVFTLKARDREGLVWIECCAEGGSNPGSSGQASISLCSRTLQRILVLHRQDRPTHKDGLQEPANAVGDQYRQCYRKAAYADFDPTRQPLADVFSAVLSGQGESAGQVEPHG